MSDSDGPAVPVSELRDLVEKWRGEGEDLQISHDDLAIGRGGGKIACATDLEEAISDE